MIENNEEITSFIISLLEEHGTLDVAESEFKRIIADDAEMRQRYRDWCHEYGSTERNGFRDYAQDYLADREEVWDIFNEYDDDSE